MDILRNLARRKEKEKIQNKLLSEKTGLSQSHLSEIFNGKKSPSLLTVTKIADALGMEITVSEDRAPYISDRSRFIDEMFWDIDEWSEADFNELTEYLNAKRKIIDLKK